MARIDLYTVCVITAVCAFVYVDAGRKPAVHRRWPACKKDTEYVQVVKKEDRLPDDTYNEITKRNGQTKTYVCMPCTRCPSGVRQITPCSVDNDTVCSGTECIIEGCIVDEMMHSCRMPGDPNQYKDISAMMDPCDPNKMKTEPTHQMQMNTNGPSGVKSPPLERRVNSSDSFSKEEAKKTGDAPNKSAGDSSSQSAADGTNAGGWSTTEVILVCGVIIIGLGLVIIAIVLYRRKLKAANRCTVCGRGHEINSPAPDSVETSV